MSELDPEEIQKLFDASLPIFRAHAREKERERREAEAKAEAHRLARLASAKRRAKERPRVRAAAPAPVPEPLNRSQILRERSVVSVGQGKTRIQPESLRDRLIKVLMDGPKTVAELQAALGFDPRPVISKLREAGWVQVK